MKVYLVTDEKYGPQAVFHSQEVAREACETGHYCISGYGAFVIEFDVETEVPEVALKFARAQEKAFKQEFGG
jgi:hypothetical protein